MRGAAIAAAVAAVGLLAVGVVLVVGAASALSETRIGATRTAVPDQRTVELEEGKYVLFYEVDEVDDGADIVVQDDLEVQIAPAGGGEPLRFDPYDSDFTVESGGRSAVAVNTVEVPRAGAYRVRATGAQAQAEPAVVLGEPSRERALRLVLGIVVLLLGALAGVTALVLAVLVLRRRRAT